LDHGKVVLPLASLFILRCYFADGNLELINSWVHTHLIWLVVVMLVVAFLKIFGKLMVGALMNRMLPRVPVPLDAPLYSPWAWLAALKLKLVSSASAILGDASLQPQFLRLCGAKIGPNSAICESVILCEALEAGEGSFFASGNVLTSMIVLATFWFTKLAGAISLKVVTQARSIGLILCSVFFFSETCNSMQYVGFSIALVGVWMFDISKNALDSTVAASKK